MSDLKSFVRVPGKCGDGWRGGIESLRAERQRRHERPARRRRIPLAVQADGVFSAIFGGVFAAGHLGLVELIRGTKTASASGLHTGSLPICSGGDREGRKVTCIVDGDTGWLKGEKWRLTSRSGGVDAPEIGKPECAAEKRQGNLSRDRLRTLMAGGYSIDRDGADPYGRTLATITLIDGRDAGAVLIAEGLAQLWPNSGNPWCRR